MQHLTIDMKMHKGMLMFPRANCRARKRTIEHHRAETLRAQTMGALVFAVIPPCRSVTRSDHSLVVYIVPYATVILYVDIMFDNDIRYH